MAIKNFMEKHHARIQEKIENLVISPSPDKKIELRWEVEKHFLAEEKEIFTKCPSGNWMVDRILKEHKEILELFDKGEISELKRMLISHQRFEDDLFYPSLESIMTTGQIQELYTKINTE